MFDDTTSEMGLCLLKNDTGLQLERFLDCIVSRVADDSFVGAAEERAKRIQPRERFAISVWHGARLLLTVETGVPT